MENDLTPNTPNPPPLNTPPIPVPLQLAAEQTAMANERTLLAYLRTSLGILVVAVTIIKLFESQGMHMLAYGLVFVGVICLTIGLMRFHDVSVKLNSILSQDKKTD